MDRAWRIACLPKKCDGHQKSYLLSIRDLVQSVISVWDIQEMLGGYTGDRVERTYLKRVGVGRAAHHRRGMRLSL